MVNTMQKCSRSNVKARRWMEANGYSNIHIFGHTRWSKDVHVDDMEFDGLATHGDKFVFYQIKSNCMATKSIRKYKVATERFKAVEFIWFNAIDRKGLFINNIKC